MEPFPKSKRWSNLSLLIELFLVLTQLQRGNDLVISTSSIITIFFTQAIFIQYQMTNGQRQNKTEKK